MDVVLFDQLLRLGARGCGNAGGISHDQLDLAARQRVFPLLQEHCQREIHVDAARGEWTRLSREQPDAYWLAVLAKDKVRGGYAGNSHAGDATDKLSARNRHWTLPGRHK